LYNWFTQSNKENTKYVRHASAICSETEYRRTDETEFIDLKTSSLFGSCKRTWLAGYL